MITPKEALKQHFGFDEFREGQEFVVKRIIDGQHTMLVMPTGAGKSLTYQLPALMLPGLTLVISPLIALMKDQVDSLVQAGVKATFVNSSLPTHEAKNRLRAVQEGHVKLLYVAPERLRSRQFMQALARVNISLLAVDEAHCVSQWGHDFRPDYLRIKPAWQAMGQPTILATTATATPAVQQQVVKLLGINKAKIVVAGFNRPNLHLSVKHLADDEAKLQTLQSLLHKQSDGSAIIYTATRKNSEMVADFIQRLGLPAAPYHAGLDRDTRYRIQTDFKADRLRVVVATNAFGMGVDKPTVRLVVHYNIPGSVEAYYQEAGRAGRDGLDADCVVLFTERDRGLQEFLIKADIPTFANLEQLYNTLNYLARDGEAQAAILELANTLKLHPTKLRVCLSELEQAGLILHQETQGVINQWRVLPFDKKSLQERYQAIERRVNSRLQLLETVTQYVHLADCRRQFLLNYFGDVTPPKSPRCCDNHADDKIEDLPRAATPEEWYPLIILETIATLPRPVGRTKLAEILYGNNSAKMRQFGYHEHKFYGKLGTRLSQRQIIQLIDTLIKARYTRLTGGDYPVLEISPSGQKAIDCRAALPVAMPAQNGAAQARATSNNAPKRRSTVDETLELLQQGYTPMEISIERGIKEVTVYSHLTQLITQGKISASQVVESEVEQEIIEAINQVGRTDVLFPIKMLLPESITYEQIRCVVAEYGEPTGQPATDTTAHPDPIRRVVALRRTATAADVPQLLDFLQHDEENVRRLAALTLGNVGAASAVEMLLTRLAAEDTPQVRHYIVKALGQIGDGRARPALEALLENGQETGFNQRVIRAALQNLAA